MVFVLYKNEEFVVFSSAIVGYSHVLSTQLIVVGKVIPVIIVIVIVIAVVVIAIILAVVVIAAGAQVSRGGFV